MTTHPAKFSWSVLDRLTHEISHHGVTGVALDPFAGVGGIHHLASPDLETLGVEIEPEWAACHPRTIVGNSLQLPFPDGSIDCVVTSPCYGNRMADSHNAQDSSKRITYRHTLGRVLHPENSGGLQWGVKYREFHHAAWAEVKRVLGPGGFFFLNISNHVRGGQEQLVSEWHLGELVGLGFKILRVQPVETPRLKFGANRDARVQYEQIITAQKP